MYVIYIALPTCVPMTLFVVDCTVNKGKKKPHFVLEAVFFLKCVTHEGVGTSRIYLVLCVFQVDTQIEGTYSLNRFRTARLRALLGRILSVVCHCLPRGDRRFFFK